MLTDSINLIDGDIISGVIESGPAFPIDSLDKDIKEGQLFYLSTTVEDKTEGLYVFDGETWASSGGSTPADPGTGTGDGIDESAYWMGA